jgi:hypothetical protein
MTWNFISFMYVLDAFRDNAEECCTTGRIQAESTKTCSMPLQILKTDTTKNPSVNCRVLAHICCLSNLRSYFCDEGIKTALRLLPCNQTKLESKDSYQVI